MLDVIAIRESKLRSLLLTGTVLAGLTVPTHARPGDRIYAIRPPYIVYNDVGELTLEISNVGVLGNPNFHDGPGAAWEGGEYLYAAALWIGAIAQDQQPHVSTGTYEFELRPTLDPVDCIYLSREGWPGGNRWGVSAQADDDNDGRIDEETHNGKDDDNDGQIDEDFAAKSEQMTSCEYWDYTPEAIAAYPEHYPLNVLVRQRSLAWSESGIDDFVGVEYSITNVGAETLRDVVLGLFVDSDCGQRTAPAYWGDDGGFWTHIDTVLVRPGVGGADSVALEADLAYMFDTPSNAGEDVEGFFGVLLLEVQSAGNRKVVRSPAMHTLQFFSGPGSDPTNDAERYAAMTQGTRPESPTSGPNDYRYLFATQPVEELAPGEQVEFVVALIAGLGHYDPQTGTPDPRRGPDGFVSDRSLYANAVRACELFHGRELVTPGQPPIRVHWAAPAMTVGPVSWQPGPRRGPHRSSVGQMLDPAEERHGALGVYDALGRKVRTLTDQVEWDGRYQNGRQAPSGIYFLRPEGARASEAARRVVIWGR